MRRFRTYLVGIAIVGGGVAFMSIDTKAWDLCDDLSNARSKSRRQNGKLGADGWLTVSARSRHFTQPVFHGAYVAAKHGVIGLTKTGGCRERPSRHPRQRAGAGPGPDRYDQKSRERE